MATIRDIPLEILSHIFSFLPAESLAVTCRVCRTFREACEVELVWQNRCQSGKLHKKLTNLFELVTCRPSYRFRPCNIIVLQSDIYFF